jgi:DNA mismatch endonuclease (patch repair protein)
MPDIVSAETRSRMMSGIRGKNTAPEVVVRRGLHARGFRFRLHAKDLPGKPDLVLAKWNAVVLVHGCFWHRHQRCRFATSPATRPEFWAGKFASTVLRDQRNLGALHAAGWRTATVWECGLKRNPVEVLNELDRWLRSERPTVELGSATP